MLVNLLGTDCEASSPKEWHILVLSGSSRRWRARLRARLRVAPSCRCFCLPQVSAFILVRPRGRGVGTRRQASVTRASEYT